MMRKLNEKVYYGDNKEELLEKGTEFELVSCELDDEYKSGVKVEVVGENGNTYYLDVGLLYDPYNF